MPSKPPNSGETSVSGTLPKRRFPGARRTSLAAFVLVFFAAYLYLPDRREHTGDRFAGAIEFISHAVQPTLFDESPAVTEEMTPFWLRCLDGLLTTFVYAFIALSLAVPAAFVLGFLASRAWWPALPVGRPPPLRLRILRGFLQVGFRSTRVLIAFLRSIHELLWATLFLAAVGDSPFAACLALALPFGGTLAKVFSEIIDEAPRNPKLALTAVGASAPTGAFLVGLVPQAIPDLLTYTLYRLECAVRSAAVLGFIGIETIGLYIHQSFENFYYREVWTELYLLLFSIIALDMWGAAIRRRLNDPAPSKSSSNGESAKPSKRDTAKSSSREATVETLRRKRPKSSFLRVSFWILGACVVFSWVWAVEHPERPLFGGQEWDKRVRNAERFVKKLIPEPVKESGDWADAIPWFKELWDEKGAQATAYTIAVSVAAILIAAAGTLLFVPFATRALSRPRPFGLAGRPPPAAAVFLWKSIGGLTRFGFIVARAIPEYIYAYLLLQMLGPTLWALVFALALHNFGILGRLWGEVVENAPTEAPKQAITSGGGRLQTFFGTILPGVFGRFLLYLFYRWETCVREAVILGFLNVPTLGFFIDSARHDFDYDQMFALVLIGAVIIIVGDLISDLLRRWLRRV